MPAAVWAAGLSRFNYLEAEPQPKPGQRVQQALLSQRAGMAQAGCLLISG